MSEPSLRRISEFVRWHAERTPHAEACVLGTLRITYAELHGRVEATARALIAAGVQAGDRVATLATPHPDYWVTFLATVSIGALWVGLNPRYRTGELTYVVGDADPVVLFTRTRVGERRYDDEIAAMRAAAPSLRQVVILDDGTVDSASCTLTSFIARGAAVSVETLTAARIPTAEREPCLIVYTSGSTGRPKGAVLHHLGIVRFSEAQTRVWPLTETRFLNYFPINHIGCVIDVSCPVLVAGGTIVFMEQFAPAESLALMQAERITGWMSVPAVFQQQLALPDFAEYDLSAVQLVVWEGAAMPIEMIRQLHALVPRLATNYGMTETTSAITVLPPTDDVDVLATSVGRAYDGVEIRLVDEDDRPVAQGEPGEVLVRSLYTTLGYWRRPEATAAAFTADGFFRTGDVALQRPDGQYRIVGRLKEMYKSGGYNVYPREIEEVIASHPDVRIAAVVSRPDPRWDEVGIAYVVAERTLTAPALDAFCRERLANYKVPKAFEFVEALPLLPIGKVDKVALARRARGE